MNARAHETIANAQTKPEPAADLTDLLATLESTISGLPIQLRVVMPNLQVLFGSAAYLREFAPSSQDCCAGLGIQHHDADCPSAITFRTGAAVTSDRWLGKLYARIVTAPIKDPRGRTIASVEWIQDNSPVKRLESAFARQHDLLETINKAMIESNQNLEALQAELEENNRDLEAANQKLISLDKQKDEFVNMVSHELKAPLTSIKGSVDLILRASSHELSPEAGELLSICVRNTDRLHRLVMDLLDIARIESGLMSFKMTRFPAAAWLAECIGNVRAHAAGKQLTITYDENIEFEIEADRDRLLQVAVNLLNNAVKFTEAGCISISLALDPDGLRCSVSDSGPGIRPEILPTVFDKFSTARTTGRKNGSGTGLGLAIARAIVLEHGGAIDVKSELGRGTTFSFTVPQPPRCGFHYAARIAG